MGSEGWNFLQNYEIAASFLLAMTEDLVLTPYTTEDLMLTSYMTEDLVLTPYTTEDLMLTSYMTENLVFTP